MANTVYTIPTSAQARFDEAMPMLLAHIPAYRAAYNVDLVSIVKQGANWQITLSNPLPASELVHIKLQT